MVLKRHLFLLFPSSLPGNNINSIVNIVVGRVISESKSDLCNVINHTYSLCLCYIFFTRLFSLLYHKIGFVVLSFLIFQYFE